MKYNLTMNSPKCYWLKKKVSQNGQTPNTIWICSYCVLNRPVYCVLNKQVFEWSQIQLHPELTLWWSFLFTDGAHQKKPCSPAHPQIGSQIPPNWKRQIKKKKKKKITVTDKSHQWNWKIITYRQVSNISCTLVGNKIVDHSDVIGASLVGAAPTTSSFSTWLQYNAQRQLLAKMRNI